MQTGKQAPARRQEPVDECLSVTERRLRERRRPRCHEVAVLRQETLAASPMLDWCLPSRTLSTTNACSLRQPPPAATAGASAALSSAREVIPSFGKTL
jgi:hypothetical protein